MKLKGNMILFVSFEHWLSFPSTKRKHGHLKEIENPDLADKKNELFNETMLDEEAEEA